MNFMKSARDNVNKMMGQMGVDAQSYGRSASAQDTGMYEVYLSYEGVNYRVAVNSKATVAAFATYIYLATNVVPQRQKIIGFNGAAGQVAPLKPDADLSKLGLKTGLQLSMTLLPPGQEIDPSYLTPHPIDRVGSQCLLLEQRVDAIESLILTHRGLDPQACQRLHQLCLWYGETGLKLMLKMDEIDGDASVKAARKALVKKANAQLDRVERLKPRFALQQPSMDPSSPHQPGAALAHASSGQTLGGGSGNGQ